jgi:hypothetical protein
MHWPFEKPDYYLLKKMDRRLVLLDRPKLRHRLPLVFAAAQY